MSLTIGLASKYLEGLNKIDKRELCSAKFENDAMVRTVAGAPAHTVYLATMAMDALAKYSKSAGYTAGEVGLTWVPKTLEKDRGRKFVIDAVDDIESMGIAGANLLAEFERTQVIPELDLYRFAKVYSIANLYNPTQGVGEKVISATISSKADALSAFDTAMLNLDNDEVPKEGRTLYCTPAFYSFLRANFDSNRFASYTDKNLDRNFTVLDGVTIIEVPSGRFNSACTLTDAGGFSATGDGLNFILMHDSAVIAVRKRNTIKVIDAEDNKDADGMQINYRLYHDCFDIPNKGKCIYVHKVPTPQVGG